MLYPALIMQITIILQLKTDVVCVEAGQVVLVTCVVLVLGFLSSMYIAGMVTGHSVFNEAGHTEL